MKRFIFTFVTLSLFSFLYFGVLNNTVQAGEEDCSTGTCAGRTCTICCNQVDEAGPGDGTRCNGTPGDDVICGDSGVNSISAGKGNDIVCGDDGGDTLRGGHGCDYLLGEGDDDTLQGGLCRDRLDGGLPTNADTCRAGWGMDAANVGCETVNNPGQPGDHPKSGTPSVGPKDKFCLDSCDVPPISPPG